MKKTLFLMRHAKSSWDDPAQEDHDRPLNERGLKNATRMGAYMRKEDYAPALVLCSSATRLRRAHAQPPEEDRGCAGLGDAHCP